MNIVYDFFKIKRRKYFKKCLIDQFKNLMIKKLCSAKSLGFILNDVYQNIK